MALAGLVANYSDSDDSSGEDNSKSLTEQVKTTPKAGTQSDKKQSTDYFTAEADDSDSDSQEASWSQRNVKGGKAGQSAQTLPNPLAGSALPSPFSDSSSSVFGNRFAEREKAELAKFEKHVKMTEDHTSTRPPCFKFKKGACRKGNGCRFSHDLGFQAPQYQTNQDQDNHQLNEPVVDVEPDIQSSKKRVGVTNTMNPAKKAKQTLDKQRAHERPWTMNKNNR